MKQSLLLTLVLLLFCMESVQAQKSSKSDDTPLDELSISGLKWRSIGPALTSGRISDVAVNPDNPFEYYVASAAGGVWKTINAGNEYIPVFDNEGSYSIGCITMDPNNSNVVWVGTGENNNQRSVSYGDGIYKSSDGGATWKNMGLENSEHIGRIIVHPDNSDIVYVAAIGPLWSKGGDRGLYKTTDGGETWKAVLTVDEHTGVNDIQMDHRDPDVLYATTFQRRRHVFTYVGSGPGSGMHKSTDGGETWKEINTGLPTTEIGRIGLAISPANPEIIYAIVEAAGGKGGFFASTNRGASWEKRGDHSTSGNYYQEIIADPMDENTIYSMDSWMSVSHDGGKSFTVVGEHFKHIDNHCMWIDPSNNAHWLIGSDGGMYETFDAAEHWDFKENIPVTQFYKVAVDNDYPFYNVYGGTQDNFSIGGPSRVLTGHGITNFDWFITNDGDGFESQVDPENPDIVYAQSQYGFLIRYDRKSGEKVGIQPSEREGENSYRFNWDSPLAVSKHASGRLYFAANKVFRSNDYGNSWEVISDDLTRQIDRNTLKVYDRVVSIDAVAKNASTSLYGSIVALSESPFDEDLMAIGTDDGLIQITEDGGNLWRKVKAISGAPTHSYINSVYLSKHDANVMYVAFNHHKFGDFKPYIFKSSDKGYSWTSVRGNLPLKGSVYAIEEDHINSGLIFCGTEYGAFFSPDGGKNWKELATGLPTIAVRDIAIQERESDLVLGTFGRGFYILDDYSALRTVSNAEPTETAEIYPIRDALSWEKSFPLMKPGKAFQGDNFFTAPNLGPEAVITYYYSDTYKSLKDKRSKKEGALIENQQDAPYPTYEELKAEKDEQEPTLIFTIKDDQGKVVKKEFRKPEEGIQRFHWDLRYTLPTPIDLSTPTYYNAWATLDEGTLVRPGAYTVEMEMYSSGESTVLVAATPFNIIGLDNTLMPAEDRAEKVAFQKDISRLEADVSACESIMDETRNKLKYIKSAIKRSESPYAEYAQAVRAIEGQLKAVNVTLYGDRIKRRLDISQVQTPANRIGLISYEQKYSTSAPTQTHRDSYAIAKVELAVIIADVEAIYNEDLKQLEERLIASGAPYTPGRGQEE